MVHKLKVIEVTKFNVCFETDHGEIVMHEGEDTLIIKQGEKKIIIPIEDWDAFYGAIQIAKIKRRNA
jgi:hypothetical protein